MCRLYAQLSPRPLSAKDLLVDSRFSLLKQSDSDPGNLQKDGWGIGVFGNNGGAAVSKSPRPAFQEAAAFTAAAQAASTAVIGHLRAASNPRGIDAARLISMDNTQPYTDGTWVFAHNGTLEIPDEVASELGPLKKEIRALNDSEVYFWQFLKFLRRHGDGARAFEECVREDWALWRRCAAAHPGKPTPYTSLNALASDGRRLFAFCHAARAGAAVHGIFNKSQPWQIMSFSRRGELLVVASENLDDGAWTRFDSPEVLVAGISGGGLEIARRRYELKNGQLLPLPEVPAQ